MPGKGLVWLFEEHLLGRRLQPYVNSSAVYTPHCLPPQQRDLLLSLQHVSKSKLCHILGKQRLYQLFSQPKPDILKACHGNASWIRTHPDLLVRRSLCGKGKPLEAVLNLNYKGCILQFTSSIAVAAPKQLLWMSWGRKALRKVVQVFPFTQI